MARTSSRSNQRASAISSGSMRISSLSASANSPIINVDGNGQGCEARYRTRPMRMPEFLEDFAPHRLLDRLTGLHESGETGETGPGPPPPAAEQAALALDRQHDHNRVDSRIMMGPAVRAAPPPSGRVDHARRAALRAKAMARVPIEQRARFGENRGLAAGDRGRQGADIDGLGLRSGQHRRRAGIEREMSPSVADPEQNQRGAGIDRPPPGRDRLPVELRRRAVADQRLQLAQRQQSGFGIVEQGSDPAGILPALANAVERVARKSVNLFHRRRPIPRSPSPEDPAGGPTITSAGPEAFAAGPPAPRAMLRS